MTTLSTKSSLAKTGKHAIVTASAQGAGTYEIASNAAASFKTAYAVKAGTTSLGTAYLNNGPFVKDGKTYAVALTGTRLTFTTGGGSGSAGTTVLKGTAAANTLKGTVYDDAFYGGAGNDRITSNGGRDAAVHDSATSWGRDTIDATGGAMSIVFCNGITSANVTSSYSSASGVGVLTLTRKGTGVTGQSMTISGWNTAVDHIVYGGTMTKTAAWIKAASPTTAQKTAARTGLWAKKGVLAG